MKRKRKYNRILVARPDRIGDVILSTPVFDAIKAQCPEATVTALVRPQAASVLQGLSSVDDIITYNPEGAHVGLFGLKRLTDEIQSRVFDAAVVLQVDWKVSLAIYMAGICVRVGPLSKPYSYVLFNRGVRQSRSHSLKNEADYNLDLLALLGIKATDGRSRFPSRISVQDGVQKAADFWFESQGFRSGRPFVAVHPGMGGSALNWPEEFYSQLVSKILENGVDVLMTVGPGDEEAARRIHSRVSEGYPGRLVVYNEGRVRTVAFLGALFKKAAVVVAPSTGPLHLAAAIGKPCVSFYPPVPGQSEKRWGPYVSNSKNVSVLTPEVRCPERLKCRGARCAYFDCMGRLSVEQVFVEVEKHLHATRPKRLKATD